MRQNSKWRRLTKFACLKPIHVLRGENGATVEGLRATLNQSGTISSSIGVMFANWDNKPFGIATIGIEMRDNPLTASQPNFTANLFEESEVAETFFNVMREGSSDYHPSAEPRIGHDYAA